MKTISLTQGKIALVDDEDYERLSRHKWYAIKSKHTYYAVRNLPRENGKQHGIRMHRVILGLTSPKLQGDHKDHDGLNNQKYNLRICTNLQNSWNKKKHKTNVAGIKGIRFLGKSWEVRICINGEAKAIGLFPSLEQASTAYNAAALNYFGEFAHLN